MIPITMPITRTTAPTTAPTTDMAVMMLPVPSVADAVQALTAVGVRISSVEYKQESLSLLAYNAKRLWTVVFRTRALMH